MERTALEKVDYLMQMYASTAGKSGGEFYTPQEVSELLARIRHHHCHLHHRAEEVQV